MKTKIIAWCMFISFFLGTSYPTASFSANKYEQLEGRLNRTAQLGKQDEIHQGIAEETHMSIKKRGAHGSHGGPSLARHGGKKKNEAPSSLVQRSSFILLPVIFTFIVT